MKKTLSSLIFAAIIAGSAAAQAGTILVGTDAGLAPFEFKDQKSEEIVGFDMDIIKAVARAVGDEAKIQNMQFAGIIPALQTNMIDVAVAAITITTLALRWSLKQQTKINTRNLKTLRAKLSVLRLARLDLFWRNPSRGLK